MTTDAFFSQGSDSCNREKNFLIFGSKEGASFPPYSTVTNGFGESTETFSVISVWQADNVKLKEGFLGSWIPCLPQYFIRAMLEGERHEEKKSIIQM